MRFVFLIVCVRNCYLILVLLFVWVMYLVNFSDRVGLGSLGLLDIGFKFEFYPDYSLDFL